MISRFWNKLSAAGLYTNQDPSVKRYIILTNRFAVIIGLLACLIASIVFNDPLRPGISSTRILILFAAMAIISIVWVNHLRYYQLAKFLISWLPATFILLISFHEKLFLTKQIIFTDFFSYRFLLIATSIIPVLVYTTREIKLMVFCLLPSFVGTVLFNPLHQLIGIDFERYGFHIPSLYIMDSIILFAYVGLIGFLMNQRVIFDRFEVSLYNKQSVLQEKNKELEHKNMFINEQNSEMNAQADKLRETNDALVVATRTIEKQKKLLEKQNKSLEAQVTAKTRELSRVNEELVLNNNELRQFSHTLSHNLKSPVATFQGLLNLVDLNDLNEENRVLFRYLQESVQKMQSVFSDMNEMLELRNNLYHTIEEVDLQKQIDELHSYFYPELNANDIQFTCKLNGNRIIKANEKRIHSILYHLISNSIKFKSNERKPEICIQLQKNGKYQSIFVKDNGIGIDLCRYQEKLFYPYQRFHSHSSGKGLGLYLVKVQAESLGGKVHLDSKVNEYTSVEVQLHK